MDMQYEPPQEQKNLLVSYTINFTTLALERKLDPVIGRDSEIRRVMQILTRRTKNNPILLGDPGVGKTALVEGLALRIVAGDVPNILKDKEILSLDLASMLAGAAYRGEFEKRLKGVLNEIDKGQGKYIIFIDEIHTLVGAGAAEGAIDAANMLKPALARGALRAIGATTTKEYRRYIEKDQALARRFQPITVEEPTVEASVAILRGIKQKYELHHGIKISDDALLTAVDLSSRYITNRYLPDKAIDLLDEAASSLKIEIDSAPYKIDQLRRSLVQDEIEATALKREKDEATKKPYDEKQKIIEHKKKQLAELEAKWHKQKKTLTAMNQLRGKLDVLRGELEVAQREALLEKAAELQYGKIPEVEKKLKEAELEWRLVPEEDRLLKEQVTQDDIAHVVSRWTGVPVERMLMSEKEKLLQLESDLHERVIDQDEAVIRVARAVRRSRAGFGKPNRPIGVFLFVGPTGVGKTETAKALAYNMFNDERALIRFDMSEYSEPHSVARLVGAPPGYVGFEEGGQLTEAVRTHPYSVILFDEIEKAHPQVFNIFLQLFDEGHLTDGQGRQVNFANTLIIMTSNLGSELIMQKGKLDEEVKNAIYARVRSFIRPEILNRIDATVMFNSLNKEMLREIVKLQLKGVQKEMAKKSINIDFAEGVVEYIVKHAYDPSFGARPVTRFVNEHLIDEIAYQFIDGKVSEGDTVVVKMQKDKLVVQRKVVN